MPNIFNIADWFLSKQSMTPKKLQKLCYYYKAWGLALYNKDLLPGTDFQAWVHGPVNPQLYAAYKDYGWNDIPKKPIVPGVFSEKEQDVLDSVWLTYGGMSANALEAQSHTEEPWRRARSGISEYENCTVVIRPEWMRDYYKRVYESEQGE